MKAARIGLFRPSAVRWVGEPSPLLYSTPAVVSGVSGANPSLNCVTGACLNNRTIVFYTRIIAALCQGTVVQPRRRRVTKVDFGKSGDRLPSGENLFLSNFFISAIFIVEMFLNGR